MNYKINGKRLPMNTRECPPNIDDKKNGKEDVTGSRGSITALGGTLLSNFPRDMGLWRAQSRDNRRETV